LPPWPALKEPSHDRIHRPRDWQRDLRPGHPGGHLVPGRPVLVSIFLDDTRGRRPVFGDVDLFQSHPDWHDLLPFHEYFHGDTGRGVGASHQTGWTALVADLIIRTVGRDTTGNRP